MSSVNRRKEEQLGMPLGTAAGRLRKKILFELLTRLGESFCYRCGDPIRSDADLSIEHKTPWLHSDDPAVLFFDLDNIAFSHLSCNQGSKRVPIIKRPGSRSRFKGVSGNTNRRSKKPWRVRVWDGSRAIAVGNYSDEVAAAKAYDEAAVSILGAEAITNASLGLY